MINFGEIDFCQLTLKFASETGFDRFDPSFSAALKDIEYLFEHQKRHGNVYENQKRL